MFAKISTRFNFSIANIALFFLFVRCASSAPIENIYAKFITDMNSNKCTTPEQMKLPSNSSTGENVYLSSYLNICHNIEANEHNKEALYLCREILENLKSILCPPISAKIIANPANVTLSKEVCKEFGALKDAVPENKVVLKRLTDSFTCEIMCEGVFEKACQVLLWSYQLQPQKGEAESSNKKAKENPLQIEIKAIPDKTEVTEENKAAQKTTVTDQQTQVTKEMKQQSTNDLILTIRKTDPVVKQLAQNQIPEQQSNLLHTSPKDPSTNNLPMYQNNLVSNNSLNTGLQPPKVEEINANDLPEKDAEPDNVGLAEQEDPHDQAEQLSHDVDVADANVEPPQNIDNKKSSGLPIADETSKLPNNISPDHPDNNESHLQAKLPPPNAIGEFVEPHDEEENTGEVDGNETEMKPPVVVSETSKVQGNADDSNLNNEADMQPKAAIKNVATTKDDSTGATTKNAIATTHKKVVADVKTPNVGEAESTTNHKMTEHSSLPSQKESSDSSVVSPSTKVLSSIAPTQERMEGEDDVHEMPVDREPDQYTDLENTEGDPDDEYARQEYDGRIYEPAKNKEISPDKPNEVEVSKVNIIRQREPSFDDLSLGEKYGHQSSFPEQEDGHFFFYFLSIVLILMAGYMLFHNKQKIIALIVEGRHERRRRSHGVGYKKLETK